MPNNFIKVVILLAFFCPLSIFAQEYQIANSNLFCLNSHLGPSLFLSKDGNYQELDFVKTSILYSNNLKKLTKQEKTLSTKLKKSPRDKKLKAQYKKLKSDKKTYELILKGVVSCQKLLPILLPPAPPVVNYSNAIPSVNYYIYEGALIYANDGRYLGVFSTNKFLYESIANAFGLYGNRFQYESVFNDFGPYGSKFQGNSARNTYSTNPPILYLNGAPVAYFSSNPIKIPRIDPAEFLYAVGRIN